MKKQTDLTQICAQLTLENAKLKKENGRLRRRVDELEDEVADTKATGGRGYVMPYGRANGRTPQHKRGI